MRTVRIDGLLYDGTEVSPATPEPTAAIEAVRGGTLAVTLTVWTPRGLRASLTGSTLTLRIRPTRLGTAPILAAVGTSTADEARRGVVHFALTAAQTRRLNPGRYLYGVDLTDSEGSVDFPIQAAAFLVLDTPKL